MIAIWLIGAVISVMILGVIGIAVWTVLFVLLLVFMAPFIELMRKMSEQDNHHER